MQNDETRDPALPPSGTREALTWLRDRLWSAEFTEERVCEQLAVPSPSMLDPHHYPYYHRRLTGGKPASILIRLFLLQAAVSEEELQHALGIDAPERLAALGLVGRHGGDPADTDQPPALRARVDLYPYQGLWVATDRSDHRGEMGEEGQPDAVMALNLSSHALARISLPVSAGSRVLDLGTGCGLHALLAARAGATAVGADLNPRALAFARFNAGLNALESVSFREGDLYAPVAGELFDRILVNPAFILGPESRVLFRDGGPRGDAMSRRAIEGAPERLVPGGVAQFVGEFPTIDGEAFEERIAAWVDDRGCDLLLLRFSTAAAADYSSLYAQEPFGQSLEEYERAWGERWDAFARQGITEIAFGAVLLRRRAGASLWSVTRTASLETPLGDRLSAYLVLRDRLEEPAFPVSDDRPRLAPGVLLVDGRRWDGEEWIEAECHVSLPGDPLLPEAILPSGARELFMLCDGTRTTAEILASVTADSDDPDEIKAAAHEALRDLLERGMLLL